MPLASTAQQRFAFGTGQPWAKRWADETDFSKLPKRVRRVRKKAAIRGCSCKNVTTKGEQIAPGITRIHGNLCNVHGKYGPCDAAASGKKPKGKKPRAAAKPKKPVKTPEQRQQERTAQQAQNRADVLSRMNIAPDGQAALDALRKGEQPFDTAAIARGGLVEAGLVEQARDGSYRLTGSGRAALAAADAGDVGRAGSTIGAARDRTSARTERQASAQERKRQAAARRSAAAKKPKSGEKPAAETAAPEAAAPDAKRAQNRTQVRQAMAEQDAGLAPAGFDNLVALADGVEPDAQGADSLIAMGLAERGGDGTLRLTPAARMAVNASDRGDAKAAIDAISRATDRRTAQQDRAAERARRQQAAAGRQQEVAQRRAAMDARRAAADARRQAAAARAGARAEDAANQTTQRRQRRKEMQTLKAGNPGDYLVVEDRTKPSTWHLPVKRNGKPDHGLMGAAWASLHGGYRGNKYAGPQKDAALSKLRALYASEKMPLPSEKDYTPSFTIYKDASGADRWISVSSTAYKDRDQEIVSTKALQGAVALADASGYRGPLRFWHVPGVEFGDCDFQATAQDGRFLIESGTFRSPALAAAVKSRANGYQVSIGFTHPANEPDQNGVFSHIAIFERSLVPKGRASNPFTQVVLTKETRMLTAEKETELKELVKENPDLLKQLLSNITTTDKAAQEGGVAFKDDTPAWAQALAQRLDAIEARFKDAEPEVETKDDTAVAPEMDMATEGDTGDGSEDFLSPAERRSIVDDVVAGLLPHLNIEQKIASYVKEMQGMVGNMGAQKDAALAEVKEELKEVKAQVADLSGSQPRILQGGYRASQANATVTTDETKLKDAQPTADPVATSFAGWLQDMGIGAQPGAQQ